MSHVNAKVIGRHSNTMVMFAMLILLIGVVMPASVAAESAGRFLFTKGDVQILRGDASPQKVRRGDNVEAGDQVRTGEQSSAQLRLSDGAMIALRPNSMFKVERQKYNPQAPDKGAQATELLRGGMRAITGAIGTERPTAVTHKTPVGTIGIRGTVIDVIYVPPEGLPGLSGVAPGMYVMVLKGKIRVDSAGGDLDLAHGEIAYVADRKTAPQLRPDLSWAFERYAQIGMENGFSDEGKETSSEPDLIGLNNVLTSTAVPVGEVTPGPFAYVVATDGFSTTWHGDFLSNSVIVNADGTLAYADGGTGDIATFEVFGKPLNSGSVIIGDSNINWGSYDYLSYIVLDASGKRSLANNYTAYFITAEDMLLNIGNLPTVGSFTYNYVGGSGSLILSETSYIDVDFGSGSMSVSLDSGGDNWSSAGDRLITEFYGDGITVSNGQYGDGSISGRFVGTDADGAIAWYELPGIDGTLNAGTAAFSR